MRSERRAGQRGERVNHPLTTPLTTLTHHPPTPQVKARTSIIPFAAILEGRQQPPADWYKEFLRAPYLAVTGFTLGAYIFHPVMQAGSYWLGW